MAFNLKGGVVVWPWYVGAYLAVQSGAADPSLARTITGWVFEAPWLAFLGWVIWYLRAERSAARKRAVAPPSSAKSSTGNRGSDYFNKCPACGKFTGGAKVCRICGHDLKPRYKPSTTPGTSEL